MKRGPSGSTPGGGDDRSKRSRPAGRGAPVKPTSSRGPSDASVDMDLLIEMQDYLEVRGGSADFDSFCGAFPNVRKQQLEPHFGFVSLGAGRWDITISGADGRSKRGNHSDRRREVVTGRVVKFIQTKGFGFLQSPDISGDIFFPKIALPAQLQEEPLERLRNLEMSFAVDIVDGKPRTDRVDPVPGHSPSNRNPGPSHGPVPTGQPSGPIGAGTILRFDEGKGFGFIKPEDGGEDIFFLRTELPRELTNASRDQIVNNLVEYEVIEKADGKLRANRLVLLRRQAPQGHGGGSSSSHGAMYNERREIHVGHIRSYDSKKGFGFIVPDDLPEDLFYLRSELPPEIGQGEPRREQLVDQRVEFEVRTMPDGKLRAERIFFAPAPVPHRGPSGRGSGFLSGRIRRFDRTKGYGFIEIGNGEPDVFFMPSNLPKDYQDSKQLEGLDVMFERFINEDGKPRARNITVSMGRHHGPDAPYPPMRSMPPPAPMPPMVPMMPPPMMGPPMMPMPPVEMAKKLDGQVAVGNVVRYDVTQAFGFIKAEGIPDDIYFLRSELPPELRDAETKDQVIGERVEFQIKTKKDGKLRAQRLLRLAPSGSERTMGPRTRGRIIKFYSDKGYGFISCDFADNVFFPKSSLPKEYSDTPEDDIRDLEVSFELYSKEAGKPRANNMYVLPKVNEHRESRPEVQKATSSSTDSKPTVQPGEVLTGFIVNFETTKGYGFVKSDEHGEDIFFLRSEMPPELSSEQRKEKVLNKRVEFEARTMPDGKVRALRMRLLDGEDNDAGPEAEEERLPELSEDVLEDMARLLQERGGGCDFGWFCNRFPRVKKKQLEDHFDFSGSPGAHLRIELPPGHPLRASIEDEPKDYEESPENSSRENLDMPVDEEAQNEIPADEPAIPPGPGCQPTGVIRSYDPNKGFGFIRVEGHPEDIYFGRPALPSTFQGKDRKEMPELVGVQVSFDLIMSPERGLRADKVNLNLMWLDVDRCWLLKRARLPPKTEK